MNNSRRKFIKGIAAGSAFCAIGVAAWQLGLLDGTPSASHVGPCLREGVVLTSSQNGGQEALWQGEPVFTVNREGAALLA